MTDIIPVAREETWVVLGSAAAARNRRREKGRARTPAIGGERAPSGDAT